MTCRFSIVIPAFHAAATVADTVRSVLTQPVPRDAYECLVVDDGSRDRTADLAEAAGATVIRLPVNRGVAAARNAGIHRAQGEWVAFTDADCVPSRRWLPTLLAAAQQADRTTLGLAGKTVGLESLTPAAQFIDLIGGLDAEKYLQHEAFPWAPGCNVAYRRADLLEVGCFCEDFISYETAELTLRLADQFGGRFQYLPQALVMHRHRATWRGLWKQQLQYGRGYANFIQRYHQRWPWRLRHELRAWRQITQLSWQAAVTRGPEALLPRGLLVKQLAQRLGFLKAYYSPRERRRMAGTGTAHE